MNRAHARGPVASGDGGAVERADAAWRELETAYERLERALIDGAMNEVGAWSLRMSELETELRALDGEVLEFEAHAGAIAGELVAGMRATRDRLRERQSGLLGAVLEARDVAGRELARLRTGALQAGAYGPRRRVRPHLASTTA